MSRRPQPVFLERQGYRRRRLADAARLLPILGAALLAVPLLWPRADAPGGGVPMSTAFLYVFGVWAGLIALAAGFGLRARRRVGRGEDSPHGPGPA
ncbi:MAG TPA: hypothetical protein DEA05_03885 [Rhodobacteraceae bacterium]|nr:hypothetical protein [Paracoccaceae bacterium]